MDNPNYNPYTYRPYQQANGFETAALTLGFASIAICNCIYLSFPFGALAIIFALLSRGKKMEFSYKAKLGLILGIIGIVITIIFYIYAFYVVIQEMGSFEALLREACETLGYDFDVLFGDWFTTTPVQ